MHSPLLAVASKTRGQGRHENAEKGQKNGQKSAFFGHPELA